MSWPESNPVWQFCWLRPASSSGTNGSGLELRQVYYNGHLVLKRAHDGGAILPRQRDPDLAGEPLEHAQLLRGQVERGIVPRQREQASRACLAGADRQDQPRRASVAQPRRRVREREARDPRGLGALDEAGQIVGQVGRHLGLRDGEERRERRDEVVGHGEVHHLVLQLVGLAGQRHLLQQIVGARRGPLAAHPRALRLGRQRHRRGGRELAAKTLALGIWADLKPQLLPFCNALRKALNLAELADLPP